MRRLNDNTEQLLYRLGLFPNRLTISGHDAPDSLFHPLTLYTEIKRIETGMISGFGKQRQSGARLKESIALTVKGVSHTGEDFSAWMQYFQGEEIVVGEKDLKGHGMIDLVINSGLKRLEDYLYRQQESQKPEYNYTYRSRQEIKR